MATFEMGQVYIVTEETRYRECYISQGILLLVVALYSSDIEFKIIDPGDNGNSTLVPGEILSWTTRTASKKPLELTHLNEDDVVQSLSTEDNPLLQLSGLQNPGSNLIIAE